MASGEVVFYNIDAKFKSIDNQMGNSTVISNETGTENYVLCLVQVLRNGSVQYADSLGRAAGKLFLDSICFKIEGAGWRSHVEEADSFERATICRSLALTKNAQALNLYGHVASSRQSKPDESFDYVNLEEPVFVKTRSPFRGREDVEGGAHDSEGYIMCGRTEGLRTELLCDTHDLESLSRSRIPRLHWKFERVRGNSVRMFTEIDGSRLYLFADRDPNSDALPRKVQVEGDSLISGEYTELPEIHNGQSVYLRDTGYIPSDAFPSGYVCCAMVQSPVSKRGSWINPDDAIYESGSTPCGPNCSLDHTSHGNCIQCGQDFKSHGKGHSCKPLMCWAFLEFEGPGSNYRRRWNRGTFYSECAQDTILEDVYQPWQTQQKRSDGGSILIMSTGGVPSTDKRPFALRNKTLALSSDTGLLEMTQEASSSLFEVKTIETAGNDLARFRFSSVKYPGCYVGLSTQEYPRNPYGCEMRLVPVTADLEKDTSVFEVTMNPLGKRTIVCTSRDSASNAHMATGLIGVCISSMPQEITNHADEQKADSVPRLVSHTNDFLPEVGHGLVRAHSLPHDYDSHGYAGGLVYVRGLSLNHLSYVPKADSQKSLTLCGGVESPERVTYTLINGIVHITGIVSVEKRQPSMPVSFRPGFEILDIPDELLPNDKKQHIIVLGDNGPFTETCIVSLGFNPMGNGKLLISHTSDSALSRIFLDGVKWHKTNPAEPIRLPLVQEDVTICPDLSTPHIIKTGHVCYLGGAVEKKPTEFALREFSHEKATLLRLGMDTKKYEPKAGIWSPGDRICQLPQKMRPSAPMYFIVLAEAAPDWCDPFDPSSKSQSLNHSGSFRRFPSGGGFSFGHLGGPGRSGVPEGGRLNGGGLGGFGFFGGGSGGGPDERFRVQGGRGREGGRGRGGRPPPSHQRIIALIRAFDRSPELLDAFMSVDAEFKDELTPPISSSKVDGLHVRLLVLLSENPHLMEEISKADPDLFQNLRDSEGPKTKVSVESVAGGHRLVTSNFQCKSCHMAGPSCHSSDLVCMGCGICAVCCSQGGSMCPSAGPDAIASTHTVSKTASQVDCTRCRNHSRSNEASYGRCTACSLCSVCCTKSPICGSAPSAFSAPSASNVHPGCAFLRQVQKGNLTCRYCGGHFEQCFGSYGYRNYQTNGLWTSGPCPADLSLSPESPNSSWCTAECERLGSGNSAPVSQTLMSEGEILLREMIAQHAERDVIESVLGGFHPAEAEAIRARLGLSLSAASLTSSFQPDSGNQPSINSPALSVPQQPALQMFQGFQGGGNPLQPPISENEALIRDMMAQNAERDVIEAVLAGIDPAEADVIRVRLGL